MDEAGTSLPVGAVGEIVIRGPNVFHAYEKNPGANKNAFCDGWFRTGDQGYMDEEGYFYITGRLKEIVNRGGEKISPREVDEVLLEHSAINQAVAFGIPHASLGEDLAAAVVLKDAHTVSKQDLRQFVFDRLADYKVPSQIIFVSEIPKGPTGKLQRIGLSDKLHELMTPDFIEPRTDTEALVISIYEEVLKCEKIGVQDNFFWLGGDSLKATQVVSRICSIFDLDLPLVTIFRHPTPADLAQELSSKAGEADISILSELMEEIEELSEAEVQQLLDEEFRRK